MTVGVVTGDAVAAGEPGATGVAAGDPVAAGVIVGEPGVAGSGVGEVTGMPPTGVTVG